LGVFGLGFLLALLVLVVFGWLYLRFGAVPVGVEDGELPMERSIAHTTLDARIGREMETPPFGTSEDAYEMGAKVYVASCASCHGTPGHESFYGKWMAPAAPQLWKKHGNSNGVGVSDDEVGVTYWKVKHGIRLTGMPEYEHLYAPEQLWDVSLLLKNADQTLPEPVMAILTGKPKVADAGGGAAVGESETGKKTP
jgi:mono/diheme cytochrome c family protein